MRKQKTVIITKENAPSEEGRDYGKAFLITEMSAFDAEEWSTRATLALIPRLSKEVSPEVAAELEANPSMPFLDRIGVLLGGISFPETKELMQQLWRCIVFIPDPTRPDFTREIGVGGSEDIEEIETIHFLRKEALAIHSRFTLAAAIFNLIADASKASPY